MTTTVELNKIDKSSRDYAGFIYEGIVNNFFLFLFFLLYASCLNHFFDLFYDIQIQLLLSMIFPIYLHEWRWNVSCAKITQMICRHYKAVVWYTEEVYVHYGKWNDFVLRCILCYTSHDVIIYGISEFNFSSLNRRVICKCLFWVKSVFITNITINSD